MSARGLGRAVVIAAIFGCSLALRLSGAQTPVPPSDEPVISLPPLMVEEKDRGLQWRYVERPGFEVLSVCDDSTTRRFVERQMRLAELLEVVLPARFQAQLTVPEAHVLFNEETGRARSREIVAEMVRKAGARVSADGVVESTSAASNLPGWARAPRVQFLPNMRLADLDSVRVFAILDESATNRMDFVFSVERVAFLLARRTPALPDWFSVGMLGVYRRLGFGENEVEFHPLVWLGDEESAALAHDADRPRTLLPMSELFTRRPVNEGVPTTELGRVWQAQCALFVRWALADPSGVRRAALWQWLDHLESHPPTEEAFRACFGVGYADMRDLLSDYLPSAVDDTVIVKGPKPGARPPMRVRPATDLEVARIRGDWERLEIALVRQRYPALTGQYVEQARRTLRRAYDRGERDPRLLAELGLTECDAGNPAAGRDFLETAVRAGVIRPRAYLELARLRFQDATAADADHRLTIAETASVLDLLREACRAAPPLPEVYTLAGRVWLQTESRPTPADLAMLGEGVRLFPSVPSIVISAINFHFAAGAADSARAFAQAGWQNARDAAVRERFARVQAELAKAK